MTTVAVLGAGSWGSALAIHLARNGHRTLLWGHRPEHIHALQQAGENARYLPGFPFPPTLQATNDLAFAVEQADLLLAVVPSAHFAGLLEKLAPLMTRKPLIWAIKGFEHDTGRLLSDVFAERFGTEHPHGLLAGPSFAREVASGQPTAVTIASPKHEDAEFFARTFHSANLICYLSDDLIGVQIGGAVKNVIAIATGIADGLGCGANTRAALITRGLHETTRLAVSLGANPKTLSGLTGLGDLVLTATDDQSRNRRFGLALGRGQTAAEAKAEIGQVVEGEGAAHDTWALAQRQGIHMPITEHVHKLLNGELTVTEAFASLTHRALKDEEH